MQSSREHNAAAAVGAKRDSSSPKPIKGSSLAGSSPVGHLQQLSPHARPQRKLTVAQYQLASSHALDAEVQLVQVALRASQEAHGRALAEVNKCTSRIQQLQQQVR